MVDATPDFSGWATKNDLRCTDGRTIKPGAFKHQDKETVPLVWMHQHKEPENVLGHAVLEDRAFGTYTYGFFNESERAQHMKAAVKHKDIVSLSIWANNLTERNGRDGREVYHGDIKEVSLVLAGANPGAMIENVSIAHGDRFETLDDEAIIYTGLELEHQNFTEGDISIMPKENEEESLEHAAEDKTVEEVFNEFTDEQKTVVYYMVGAAVEEAQNTAEAEHSDDFTTEEFLAHVDSTIQKGIEDIMGRNVFDQTDKNEVKGGTLSHSQLEQIISDAKKPGATLKSSFLEHAVEYGFEDIDFLFPDAKTLANSPELISRRTAWVAGVIGGTKHSPFSRIKSVVADITADEARAKGYVKGNMKKDEIIKLLKRTTTPTTIYKKQKLDRDDIIDITDLDVVAWLKAEMRLMLEEEMARAILIGDGREPDDEDKIDEDHLRPIAFDDDMYTHKITLASNVAPADIEEAILRSRTYYKGTGMPTLYTTDLILTDLLLQKDRQYRRIYKTEEELAAALRVKEIVVVEVMEDTPDLLAILVNLADYTIGADKGGAVSMFDDFDIDYNQYKYLIETRASGALTKPKGALVIKKSAGTVVVPQQPTYVPATHVITIPNQTGVVYSIDGVDLTAGAQDAITETVEVEARPASGYTFPHNTDADWTFIF